MNLILEVKLKPTKEQVGLLKATQRRFNEACNFVSQFAFKNKIFNQYQLHSKVYREIRQRFQLPAQLAVRVIAKVSNSYSSGRKSTLRRFRPLGSVVYDSHILSFLDDEKVSIRLLDRRDKIFFDLGEYQRERWEFPKGQVNLVLKQGKYFLQINIKVPEESPIEPEGFLGVDFGIVNIATDSSGEIFSGEKLNRIREKSLKLRKDLQACGSKSARRHLKKVSKRESNFTKNINHITSKKLVEKAKRTCQGIALENLKGIRRQSKAWKSRQVTTNLNSWAFHQLRFFIEYKSQLAGVPVILVDPAYTSQTCSVCGHVNKDNRKSQSDFRCVCCGHEEHADVNAAKNISKIAAVNQRIVGSETTKAHEVSNCVAA